MLPFIGHTKPVTSVAFSPDSSTLISGARDGKIIIWDRFAAKPKHTLSVGHSAISTIACHPDGERFASGYRYSLALLDSPDRLRFWDINTGEPCEVPDDNKGMWHRAERLATGRMFQEISILDCEGIRDLHFLPDRESFVMVHGPYLTRGKGTPYHCASWWQLEPEVKTLDSWLERRSLVTALSLSTNGEIVAVASQDFVRVGRLDAQTVSPAYKAPGVVKSIALSPDGSRLAGSSGAKVTIWETVGGQEVQIFTGHEEPVQQVAYRADGEVLASAGLDGKVLLWEPDGGAIRATYDWNLGPIHALAFSPDSLTLAVAGDGGLMLFDLD
jgi:WD40 repeat protein